MLSNRYRRLPVLFLIFVLLVALAAPAQAENRRDLRFMTRNLYLGASLTPIFAAAQGTDPNALVGAASAAWLQILASDFPSRAEELADELAAEMPDLVGLQEVTLYRMGPFNPAQPATTPVLDFLGLLQSEIAERDLPYAVVSQITAFDGELTVFTPSGLRDIRLTDRDVILARTDLPTSLMKLSNPQSGLYDAHLTVPSLFVPGGLPIVRGWTSVDVKSRGKTFRFIDTHLEAFSDPHQVAQSIELLNGPADTSLPVVMAGDFNSPADGSGSASYGNIVAAGFSDVWSEVFPGDTGYTCCHDADLISAPGDLHERIDILFFRGGDMSASEAEIIGEEAGDKTPAGLWPSDHAGVVGTISVKAKT